MSVWSSYVGAVENHSCRYRCQYWDASARTSADVLLILGVAVPCNNIHHNLPAAKHSSYLTGKRVTVYVLRISVLGS